MRKLLKDKSGVSKVAIIGIIIVVIVVGIVAGYLAVNQPARTTPTQTATQTQAAPVRFEVTNQDSKTPWGFVISGQQNPDLKVSRGATVEIVFKNAGVTIHDFTIDEFGVTKAKTQLDPGKSVTVTFTADKSGTFTYYCSQQGHKDLGMKGNFIVS